jgi:hypothetical protein
VVAELGLILAVRVARSSFPWLITEQDELPELNWSALEKFLNGSFDPHLGWVRKPNSSGTEQGPNGKVSFAIDSTGSRVNGFNTGPASIAAFGDSYAFCRQVEDDETWEAQLARDTGYAVLNFGVGNYGVDQALLRYENMMLPDTVRVVVMGFVPESICRVQSSWKHYLEFGNTFAFKPRFALNAERGLVLLENPVKGAADFANLETILPRVQTTDAFYQNKFRSLQFRFPYLLALLRNPGRHLQLLAAIALRALARMAGKKFEGLENLPFALVMKENIRRAHRLYGEQDSTELLREILRRFRAIAMSRGHVPAVVVMPQLFDLKLIGRDTPAYRAFYRDLGTEFAVLDLTDKFARDDVGNLYINDQYGGHLSPAGNLLVAREILAWVNGSVLHRKE